MSGSSSSSAGGNLSSRKYFQSNLLSATGVGYMTPQGITNLKQGYKYASTDRSLIAPIFQHFWTPLAEYLPRNHLAPNLITLIGLAFIIFSFLLNWYYLPNLIEDNIPVQPLISYTRHSSYLPPSMDKFFASILPVTEHSRIPQQVVTNSIPSMIFYIHAICLFVYQTMDALDGKQARRTGNSSPLGELFDHGCDALSTSLVALTTFGALQLGGTYPVLALLCGSLIVFFVAQWMEFHTGFLDLGRINVTEVQLICCAVYVSTGIMGPAFWRQTFIVGPFTIQYNALMVLTQIVSIMCNLLVSLLRIRRFVNTNSLPKSLVYSQLIPLVMSLGFAVSWALVSPNQVLQNHPTTFLLTVGLVFANLVERMLVARVCRDRFTWYQPIVLLLFFGWLNAALDEIFGPEILILQILLSLSLLTYLHFALCVINDICGFLDIYCLTLNPPRVPIPSASSDTIKKQG